MNKKRHTETKPHGNLHGGPLPVKADSSQANSNKAGRNVSTYPPVNRQVIK